MMHAYRTHTCAALRAENVGETVRVSGWVHRKRDHGGVLFVDLRDHYGITQIVAKAGSPELATLEGLRAESVVTVEGEVVARGPEATNPNLATGAIEVVAAKVTIQSPAQELPMPVAGIGATAMRARGDASARWSAANRLAAASARSPETESVSSPGMGPKPISHSSGAAASALSRSGFDGA